jgi:hypothetical protein
MRKWSKCCDAASIQLGPGLHSYILWFIL